jgi:hypothetical protein
MTTGRKVDAAPLFTRPLGMFFTQEEAWKHLVKHVLNNQGEFGSWGILILELQEALEAGRRQDLYNLARAALPDRVPSELENIWTAFLDLVSASVEQGMRREWYWEEKTSADGCSIRAFTWSGILAYLDSTVVRTGFLPYRDTLPTSCVTDRDRRYRLFYECWRKTQNKYQIAQREGRFIHAPSALQGLMRKIPDLRTWEKLLETERPVR